MQAIAGCMCYQAEQGWYGLMSPDGQIITSPSYSAITAISAIYISVNLRMITACY